MGQKERDAAIAYSWLVASVECTVAGWGVSLSVAACAVLCTSALNAAPPVEQRVLADESDGTNWPSYGRISVR
jgi:hypothetical protein